MQRAQVDTESKRCNIACKSRLVTFAKQDLTPFNENKKEIVKNLHNPQYMD
jgi:hypothetical protein